MSSARDDTFSFSDAPRDCATLAHILPLPKITAGDKLCYGIGPTAVDYFWRIATA